MDTIQHDVVLPAEDMTPGQHLVAMHALMAATRYKDTWTPLEVVHAKLDAHRAAVARIYGKLRGWTPSDIDFTPAALTRGSVYGYTPGAWCPWNPPRRLFDRMYYWNLDNRPVAITCHVANCTPDVRERSVSWGQFNRLCVTFPDDFPCWEAIGQNPTLVEITRR
jgi:hypothetical protein